MDYFTLFSMPVAYQLDQALLEKRYQELQRQYHPDTTVTQSPSQRLYSLQQASLINEAYQVLKQPLRRAEYWLSLHGINIAEQRTIADTPFLTEQLALHEELAEIGQRKDMDALWEFEQRIGEKIADYYRQMYHALEQQNWPNMAEQVTKLQFFTRIHQQIEQIQEQFLEH